MVAFVLVDFVAAVVVVDLNVVAVDAFEVVDVDTLEEEVVPEPPPLLNVLPMSPQRMLLKTTCVVGLFWRMSSGLPSVVLQGPLLPVSSQFIYPLASFQMAKLRTTGECEHVDVRVDQKLYLLPRASA